AARGGRIPFGRALVVAQMALSLLLLIGGALLVHSMQQLLHSDIGVDRDHVVAVRVRTARSPYVGGRLGQLRRDLAERVRQLPGVDAAAFADHGLFSGGASGYHVTVPGFVAQADSERRVSLDRVGPNFFHAIGARVIRGRDIEPRDLATVPPATVINETMAQRYFGARDPLGVTVTVDSVPYTIGGVARDRCEGRAARASDDVLLYRHVGARGTRSVRRYGVFDQPAHQRARITRGARRRAGRCDENGARRGGARGHHGSRNRRTGGACGNAVDSS